MSDEQTFERIAHAWLADGPERAPERAIQHVLLAIETTPQERGLRVPWRTSTMDSLLRVAAVAAAVAALIAGPLVFQRMTDEPGSPALPPTACPSGSPLPSGTIVTIAGTGRAGYTGDGGPAIDATVSTTYGSGVTVAPDGAVVFSDPGNHVIRRVGRDGVITTTAGTGQQGTGGDGGPATDATLTSPGGLVFDTDGALLVADLEARRIRRIDPAGTISTVAGTGRVGNEGNGGPAVDAQIQASGLGIGPAGELYLDDNFNFRMITPDGTIDSFAGTGTPGFAGDGGPAREAQFNEVNGIAVDENGRVYLGDAGGHRIRLVDTDGTISTIAGTGEAGHTGDGGPATEAAFGYPGSLALDPEGNLYVSDWTMNAVRRIDPDGVVTTIAGTGANGYSGDCGPAVDAALRFPTGLAIHDDILYLMDANNQRIRAIVL
jgi:sugar lactone lactonase YvrE